MVCCPDGDKKTDGSCVLHFIPLPRLYLVEGQEMEKGTWDCTYEVKGNTLELTTSDGTVFKFEIQKNGDAIRIFNEKGKEFLRSNG